MGVKFGQKVEPWPHTFAQLLDGVFGSKLLSWKSFLRSAILTIFIVCLVSPLVVLYSRFQFTAATLISLVPSQLLANVVPGFCSSVVTRLCLRLINNRRPAWLWFPMLGVAAYLGYLLGVCSMFLSGDIDEKVFGHSVRLFDPGPGDGGASFNRSMNVAIGSLYASLASSFAYSIGVWLYAGSGFLLKFACRFDIGFQRFNQSFDIKKKPLQSIGLVAGVLVALIYWAAVVLRRVMGT